MGQNIIAIYGPVAEIAKPFIELALFETGAGVLFQAVKGIISVRWGVQLAKIGVNTASITTITNRLVNGLSFGAKNASLTHKIGGRNLYGSAIGTTTSSRVAYRYNGVTSSEAKALFQDMTAGRQIKRVEQGGGKYFETATWGRGVNKRSVTLRNHSTSGQDGDLIIDINMPEIRSGVIELKFFP